MTFAGEHQLGDEPPLIWCELRIRDSTSSGRSRIAAATRGSLDRPAWLSLFHSFVGLGALLAADVEALVNETGLEDLARVLNERHVRSVTVPPLGCGLGGLRWEDVRPRIEAALGRLDHTRVLVFEPADKAR